MSKKPHISKEFFEATFPHLVVGRHLLPKKRHSRLVLLLSTVRNLERDKQYSEAGINEYLKSWIHEFGADLSIDYVTLRRYLVDEAILERDTFGSAYSLSGEQRDFTYDETIRSVNLEALVSRARADQASRKRAYLVKATGGAQ